MRKNLFIIGALISILFSACNNHEAEDKKVSSKMDSLSYILNARDSTINDLLTSFTEVQKNLDSVSIKQNLVSLKVSNQKGEFKKNIKDEINEEINNINNIIEQNRLKIEELSSKLKKSTNRIGAFQKMIKDLNEQIMQKNSESEALNGRLDELRIQVIQLQTSVDTLTKSNDSKSSYIASQTEALHTAFYLVGKSKELAEMKVIDKSGGLLGIGKTSKLSPDFDTKNFTKIDYTKMMTIPIDSKDVKIVTTHPTGSYTIDMENKKYTNLRITQPEQFWSASKYLVVLVK
jgi:predicted  nucleic acid-binding Zn-ribbon protein